MPAKSKRKAAPAAAAASSDSLSNQAAYLQVMGEVAKLAAERAEKNAEQNGVPVAQFTPIGELTTTVSAMMKAEPDLLATVFALSESGLAELEDSPAIVKLSVIESLIKNLKRGSAAKKRRLVKPPLAAAAGDAKQAGAPITGAMSAGAAASAAVLSAPPGSCLCDKRDQTEFETARITDIKSLKGTGEVIPFSTGVEGMGVMLELPAGTNLDVTRQRNNAGQTVKIVVEVEGCSTELLQAPEKVGRVILESGSMLLTDPSYIWPEKARASS